MNRIRGGKILLDNKKRWIVVKSPAKINLFLDVVGREKTGFHKIITLFQAVTLFDKIIIKKSKKARIVVNNKQLKGRHNIVEDVIECYRTKYRIKQNFSIKIKKRIPAGAGLGGGSSDAAAVLWGINKLMDLDLSYNELSRIGTEIGKDIPFFFHGGTQIGKHHGEVLSRLDIVPDYYILIIYPGFEISTKGSYQNLKVKDFNKGKEYLKRINLSIKTKNPAALINNLYNIFEKNALKKFPVLKRIKDDLIEDGADYALMSGSGSAIFGIVKNKKNAKKINKKLKKKYKNIILVEPIHYGLIKA